MPGWVRGAPQPALNTGDLELIDMPSVADLRQPRTGSDWRTAAVSAAHYRTVSWLTMMPRADGVADDLGGVARCPRILIKSASWMKKRERVITHKHVIVASQRPVVISFRPGTVQCFLCMLWMSMKRSTQLSSYTRLDAGNYVVTRTVATLPGIGKSSECWRKIQLRTFRSYRASLSSYRRKVGIDSFAALLAV